MCTNNVTTFLETDQSTMSDLKLTKVSFPRMASAYLEQLSEFIIPVTRIKLIETIGQGIVEHMMIIVDLI